MANIFTRNNVRIYFSLLINFFAFLFSSSLNAQTNVSVLSDGAIYKIAFQESGVYKLDYNFLKNQLGISNLDAIDPRTIKLFTNGGGMLPEANSVIRPDDITQNAITIIGEEDGKFDASDFILFFANGANKWTFDENTKTFDQPKNIYDNSAYAFIKVGGEKGLRVASVDNPSVTKAYQSNSYDYRARWEEDKTNVLASTTCGCTQGSGKVWVGDLFTTQSKSKDYSANFNFTQVVPNGNAHIMYNFVAASYDYTSVSIKVGSQIFSEGLGGASPNNNENTNATNSLLTSKFKMDGSSLNVNLNYDATSGSLGWLDFLQLTYKRNLIFENAPLFFRDINAIDSATTFTIKNASTALTLWNISTPFKPNEQKTIANGNSVSFNLPTQKKLQEFVLFDKNSAFPVPQVIGTIANQNLHGIAKTEFVIVYPKNFKEAALKLQQHKIKVDGISTAIAEVGEVYNEFSSGAKDPSAIRDFARFLVKKDSTLKYLLLMGDGSFDARDIYSIGTNAPSNFIPAYETDESFSPISAFTSDDFYALLSDDEGVDLRGDLVIGVGRIPCKTNDEALAVVNKIIRYETQSFGAWRNDATFFCDNGDYNRFISDIDPIANNVTSTYKNLNVDKLYLDAYKLEVSAGGARAPGINDALFQKSVNGNLTMCYVGHGGSRGLSQERILMREDLAAWQNIDKLPLIITATCQFTGYDNPKEISAGEVAILNPNGGAIALFSTVRLVEATSNATLTEQVFNNIYKKTNGVPLRLGEIFKLAKNSSATYTNGQKFTLIGDPSMRLNLPRYTVRLDQINGKTATAFNDTIKALQKISLAGTIVDEKNATLSDFTGTLDVTLFDKSKAIQTLGQVEDSPPQTFTVQNNVLFKGSATVRNGLWTAEFNLPKDIDFTCGKGKFSFYAQNGKTDANGIFEPALCKTDSTVASAKPPVINLFLNDTNFKNGGSVGTSPNLIVQLSDALGINISGNSIGHDLTLTLDSSKSSVNLNNFYRAARDNSNTGTATYGLKNLSLGEHSLKVKAWNLNNLSSEASINFTVIDNPTVSFDSVFVFPNPFSDVATLNTVYNSEKTVNTIRLNVYNTVGVLVKTIVHSGVNTSGTNTEQFVWNSTADGDNVPNGFYLFVFEFDTADSNGATVISRTVAHKLVLMK